MDIQQSPSQLVKISECRLRDRKHESRKADLQHVGIPPAIFRAVKQAVGVLEHLSRRYFLHTDRPRDRLERVPMYVRSRTRLLEGVLRTTRRRLVKSSSQLIEHRYAATARRLTRAAPQRVARGCLSRSREPLLDHGYRAT